MQSFKFDELSNARLWSVGVVAFLAGITITNVLSTRQQKGAIYPSPLKTLLPSLSESEKRVLPYPSDALPGARDVDSPFGTTRIYEFGPEDGRKVLLVHGISTPCLALGGVAHTLADKGCRVMLFDLVGRGYSDTPADLDHDTRLFMSQIFIVLGSSKLAWTGTDGFSMIGYSLGGGISAAFTSYFPDLVRSLVLIAPAGLIRDRHISRTSKLIYAKETIFEPILLRVVKGRLRKPVQATKQQKLDTDDEHGAQEAVQAETDIQGNQKVMLSKAYPQIAIEAAVNHQIEHHEGFVAAFMSSIRYGPIQRQHARWRVLGDDLKRKDKKALVILGERDSIIDRAEIEEDARDVLQGMVEFVVMDAGHEAPVAKGPETAEHIWKFWEQQ